MRSQKIPQRVRINFYGLKLRDSLTPTQWGFLEGKSTVTALIKCTDDWLRCLEEGNDICAVFFDYQKAFDSVPHRPLVVKLRTCGLDDCIINWIKHYLAERFQVIAVDGSESNPLPVLSGFLRALFLGRYSFYFTSMTSPMLYKTHYHI